MHWLGNRGSEEREMKETSGTGRNILQGIRNLMQKGHENQKKEATDDLFLFDEWGAAKKIGVKPRHVVLWRRNHGVEGIDFERCRGFEGGERYERIGMTAQGVKRAAESMGFAVPRTLDGCELVKKGVQLEIKKKPANTRLLICERGAGKEIGALDVVTVRNSDDFRIGEEFVVDPGGSAMVKNGSGLGPWEW
jgi:hypothetical protein